MNAQPLRPQEVDQLAEALVALRRELESRDAFLEPATRPVQLDQQAVGRVSRIDAIAQQQMDSARRKQGTERLRAIIVALARVDSGDYGYCRQCDEPIGFARLSVQPETALCMACQQGEEIG